MDVSRILYERERCLVKTKDLLAELMSLPYEERARIAEIVLNSLNAPEPEIDRKWAEIAKRRLEQLRSGEVKPVQGEEVFERIKNRFSK
jgi:putative addiction module component (TIGR02574 family)